MARKETVVNRITSFDESWDNNHTGQEVEDFITTKLIEADGEKITNMSYVDQQLILHKANGDTVKTEVSVITPKYYYGIKLYGIRIDSDNDKIYTTANTEVTIQYTPERKIEAGVILYAISQTANITIKANVKKTAQNAPLLIKFIKQCKKQNSYHHTDAHTSKKHFNFPLSRYHGQADLLRLLYSFFFPFGLLFGNSRIPISLFSRLFQVFTLSFCVAFYALSLCFQLFCFV